MLLHISTDETPFLHPNWIHLKNKANKLQMNQFL